mmetsp:Transcript_1882/g.4146  ORF Transcript_1882/g.4146 Transcript_1882/m.4146 type:complete len:297 (-) Transcript_1882:6-896(-)
MVHNRMAHNRTAHAPSGSPLTGLRERSSHCAEPSACWQRCLRCTESNSTMSARSQLLRRKLKSCTGRPTSACEYCSLKARAGMAGTSRPRGAPALLLLIMFAINDCGCDCECAWFCCCCCCCCCCATGDPDAYAPFPTVPTPMPGLSSSSSSRGLGFCFLGGALRTMRLAGMCTSCVWELSVRELLSAERSVSFSSPSSFEEGKVEGAGAGGDVEDVEDSCSWVVGLSPFSTLTSSFTLRLCFLGTGTAGAETAGTMGTAGAAGTMGAGVVCRGLVGMGCRGCIGRGRGRGIALVL